jgi:hypothetical protein
VSAVDVSAQVRAWVLAEVERQCFGEEFGADVGWEAMQTPAGIQVGYRIVLSCRSPLLGQGPLFSMAPMLTPRPEETQVTEAVTELLRQLRMVSAQVLKAPKSAQNGHPK